MNKGEITIQIRDRVGTIQFFHPQSNCFPSAQLERLTKAVEQLGADKEVKVIVLKSEGERAFCAGASFDELLAVADLEEAQDFFSGFARVILAMINCPKIIISRVQGKAVGGGVGLIAGSDYSFALESADIRLSELAIGIGPFVIEPVVSHKIGKSALAALSLNPNSWQTAWWAKEKGLFHKVYEKAFDMDNDIDQMASRLATYSSEAMQELKKTFWTGADQWPELLHERAAISGRLVLTDAAKKVINSIKK